MVPQSILQIEEWIMGYSCEYDISFDFLYSYAVTHFLRLYFVFILRRWLHSKGQLLGLKYEIQDSNLKSVAAAGQIDYIKANIILSEPKHYYRTNKTSQLLSSSFDAAKTTLFILLYLISSENHRFHSMIYGNSTWFEWDVWAIH